jgi:hypothetical protein
MAAVLLQLDQSIGSLGVEPAALAIELRKLVDGALDARASGTALRTPFREGYNNGTSA